MNGNHENSQPANDVRVRRVLGHRARRFIRQWKERLLDARTAALILLLFAVFTIVFGYVRVHGNDPTDGFGQFVNDFYANAGTELTSIAVTVLIIDGLNQRRATRDRKKVLILQMGSPDNAFAIEAVRLLGSEGWLSDGTLYGANLLRANLCGANLSGANLSHAHLFAANLSQATLLKANLYHAHFSEANLTQAHLLGADMSGAYLWKADASGAHLTETDLSGTHLAQVNFDHARLTKARLCGADLRAANLTGADLSHAQFDPATILPDSGEGKTNVHYWTPETDMSRYTDPHHPDFWQPEWVRDSEKSKVQS